MIYFSDEPTFAPLFAMSIDTIEPTRPRPIAHSHDNDASLISIIVIDQI